MTNYISDKFSYSDNITSRNGQLNGVYLTRKWVEGVKDVDDNLTTPKAGNSSGVVDENYFYDIMGRLVKKQDGKGYNTVFEYDSLSRIKKEIHEVDLNRVKGMSVVTPQGDGDKEYTYVFSTTGKVISVSDGEKVTLNIYDDAGRLISETEAGGIAKEYTYIIILKKFAFLTNFFTDRESEFRSQYSE